jgi:hypothetical protein
MFDDPIGGRLAALCGGVLLVGLFAGAWDGPAPMELDTETATPDRPLFAPAGAPGQLDSEQRSQLVELKRTTAPYHDVDAAMADGWSIFFPEPCLTHEDEGGMGQHLLNGSLLDDEVAVEEPEFLVYEPGPAGQMKLVAVEYVVPFTEVAASADPPTLFGHDFHPNHTFGVWAFHVWAWRHNPDGIFADWNPKVSCEHADEVQTFTDH